MPNLFQGAVVSGVRQLTANIREYVLSSPDNRALARYEPGAHIELHFSGRDGLPIVRHYSLIGGVGLWDDPARSYRIAVQREDRQRGSAWIHQTFTLGTRLRVSRPINGFPLDRAVGHTLLIAGGIGITPIYSMVRSLVRRSRDFNLVYCGRAAHLLAYGDDVLKLAGDRAKIHITGGSGRGRPDLAAVLADEPLGSAAYVCGPGGMIEAVRDAASTLGWDEGRLRYEKFSAGPTGDEVPFEVELRQSGRRVFVGRDTTVLDALLTAGVDVISSCRRGECGICPLPVIDSDGPLQHRDTYLSNAEKAAGNQICICVSRVDGSNLVLDA